MCYAAAVVLHAEQTHAESHAHFFSRTASGPVASIGKAACSALRAAPPRSSVSVVLSPRSRSTNDRFGPELSQHLRERESGRDPVPVRCRLFAQANALRVARAVITMIRMDFHAGVGRQRLGQLRLARGQVQQQQVWRAFDPLPDLLVL